jgi:arylsulfatase A-like enzyme
VVFTTDHGISAPRSKGTLYDRGVEIALLVRMPDGSGAGRRVTDLTQNIDYAPTFLDAIGAEKPSVLQGRSLWPLLTGGTWRPHDAIFTERNFHGERPFRGADHFIDEYDPIRAIRTRDFHYIRRYRPEIKSRVPLPMEVPAHGRSGEQIEYIVPETNEPRETEELYHVDHDGLEMINVARRPEYAEVKQRLARRMHDWMVATDDFVLRDQPPARPEEPSWGPHWPVVESA